MAKTPTPKIKKNLKKAEQTVDEAQPNVQANVQIMTFEQAILRLLSEQAATIAAVRAELAVIKTALFEE